VKKKVEHVFIENTKSGDYRMFCTNCGRDYKPSLPVSMDMFLAQMKSFQKEHKDCPVPDLNTKDTKEEH